MDAQSAKGLRWGELSWGLGFVIVNLATMFIRGHEEAQFYARFWFAWMGFAAFVGMSAFLLLAIRGTQILWHVVVSLVILSGIALCLSDQHFFASPGIKNWLFNLAAIVGLVTCVRLNRGLSSSVRVFAVPVTIIALCVTLFWALLSPCQIFLPVLFFPEANLASAHVVFTRTFLLGVVVSFLICLTATIFLSRRSRAEKQPTALERPISRKAGVRMIVGFLVFVAITAPILYFVPGTSSGSGGVPVEFFGKNDSKEVGVSLDEIRLYLRQSGFQPSDAEATRLLPSAKGEPVAWFRYPLSRSRDMELCLWRDSDRSGELSLYFRYSKVSAFEANRARRLIEAARKHFRDLWSASRHEASG